MKKYTLFILISIFPFVSFGFSVETLMNEPFNAKDVELNFRNALWLAHCSNTAYESKLYIEDLESKYSNFTFRLIEKHEKGTLKNEFINSKSEVLIIETPQSIFVCTRGTELNSWSDIQTDLAFKKIPWSYNNKNLGKVHIGFKMNYLLLWPELRRVLDDIQYRLVMSNTKKSIWFSGHSLGAAVSQLLLRKYLYYKNLNSFPNIIGGGFYSFGSPRVGDNEFVQELQKLSFKYKMSSFRFRNVYDPVTMVPASSNVLGLGGFKHFGQMVYINKYKKYEKDITQEQVGYDWVNVSPDVFWTNFSSHFIDEYIDVIKNNL